MATPTLSELMRQAEALDAEEQALLIAYLMQKARRSRQTAAAPRLWREISGASPYPLVGEDAQAWVSRSRQEDDAY